MGDRSSHSAQSGAYDGHRIRVGTRASEGVTKSVKNYFEVFCLFDDIHTEQPFRLTNDFSRKVENHAAAVALYFMYFNFGRVHQTLRVLPAMEAGVANHVWSVEEIVGLLG